MEKFPGNEFEKSVTIALFKDLLGDDASEFKNCAM